MGKVNSSKEAINSKELILALEELEKENGIDKDYMLEAIETALVIAYKKNYDCVEENVKITMDKETGKMHVYSEMEVVKNADDIENEKTQITLEQAKAINKKLDVGDVAQIEIIPKNFGRIAAQTAKQVITQKIREASRNFLFNEFSKRKGEIVSGIIQKADGAVVIMDLGQLEGIMMTKDQIANERYRVNDKIRAYIVDVVRGIKGAPQVMVSRSHVDFVRKLFELEIPEIYEGVIEIKSVSRDAGSRSKVAVYSSNPNIDPVGSCVGQKGIRIQNIIGELNGEKIDVIEWNEDPAIYISSALLPAQVLAVDIKDEERFAQVIVPDDQLSLAIGKAGQNARLAARLTNWKIDIKSESQFREMLMNVKPIDEEEVEEEKKEEAVEEIKEEKTTKKRVTKKKIEEKEEKVEETVEPKKRGRKKKTEEVVEEEKNIEVVEPKKRGRKKKTEESEEKVEEITEPKKRGRKKKEIVE